TDVDISQAFSQIDSSHIPLIPAPSGVRSSFDNPESHAWVGKVIIYITLALMVVFVSLRIYTRARVTLTFRADDILCLAAAAAVTAEAGVALPLLGNPIGSHAWNVPLTKYTPELVEHLYVQICLYPAAALLKSSLLIFLLRIFQPKRVAQIIVWSSLVIIVIFYSIIIIYGPVTCRPYDGTAPSVEGFDASQLPDGVNLTEIITQRGANITATIEVAIIPRILVSQQDKSGCARKAGNFDIGTSFAN
ncbi:hypothetical protein F5Y11DRAFT_362445, partial [Daldinia sp. FL1419]